MDIYLVVVRLIHIVAAVLWVGSGFYWGFVLMPSLIEMGADAGKLTGVLGKNRVFGMIFPVSAVLTVLAGILLYLRPGSSGPFSTTGWIVLSTGALAGILAIGHGGTVLGRLTGEYIAKANAGDAQAGALAQKLQRHINISLALVTIGLLGMSLARYL